MVPRSKSEDDQKWAIFDDDPQYSASDQAVLLGEMLPQHIENFRERYDAAKPDWEVAMELKTGEGGLSLAELAGGIANAVFARDPAGGYPDPSGERITKTYCQLSNGPKTGDALFAELEREDWHLPLAGRRYRLSEFHGHLRYLVRRERLHVVSFGRLTPDAARGLRSDLKSGLTSVASGRGGIAPLLHEVERVAKYANGSHRATLGSARESMWNLVGVFAGAALKNSGLRGMPWDRLYCEVRSARNDIAHTGTEAALARLRVTGLAVVLMEALLGVAREGEVNRLRDVMVADPVCAHRWQTVADARRTMLVTDFSVLPLDDGACGLVWKTVTARNLAAYLANDRTARLGRTIEQAMTEESDPLRIHDAPTASEKTPVCEVWRKLGKEANLPLFVTREGAGERKVVGIVTSFDLL